MTIVDTVGSGVLRIWEIYLRNEEGPFDLSSESKRERRG